MSNPIRYDSLLVRYLADALDERFRRRRLTRLGLDVERRRAVLDFDGEALILDLHPTAGAILIGPTPPLPEPVRLGRRTIIAGVEALPDERILRVFLATQSRSRDRPRRLMIELLTNQMNLAVLDANERITAILWSREAGRRSLRSGSLYELPPPAVRAGLDEPVPNETWTTLLAETAPEERVRTLVRGVAYTSPINAPAILGRAASGSSDAEPDDGAALAEAYDRYRSLMAFPSASPRVLEIGARRQPYPLPLPGITDEPCDSLFECMARAADHRPQETTVVVPAVHLERLRRQVFRAETRRRRLAEELADAGPEAERLRSQADLLLSQVYRVEKGMREVELDDFMGGTVMASLDPSLSPAENADRLYTEARRRERAAEQLPALVEEAVAARDRLTALLDRAERGDPVAEEVEAVVGQAARPRKGRREEAPLLPYRRYRTSGGLEVRVGRGSRSNDDLTFRHSSPDDIWLHARDVGGAHVILRWPHVESNPPSRDLAEAAVLAALHSKARTSGTVAVDWTRRKYVRKPRKSPPGLVTFERGKTLFVEPNEALERRLQVEGGG